MAMLTVLDRLNMRYRTTVHGRCRGTFSNWANETGAARPDMIADACLAQEEKNRVRAAHHRAQFNDERRVLLKVRIASLERFSRCVSCQNSGAGEARRIGTEPREAYFALTAWAAVATPERAAKTPSTLAQG